MITERPSRWRLVFTWLFGFLLPAGTLFFESLTKFCAANLFDPLPNFLHQIVVALVPLGFLFLLNVATPSNPRQHQLPFVLGVTLSISLLYTLPFVPLLGIAVIAVAYFGLGFLPLAPLLAFLVAASWIYWLARQHTDRLLRRVLWGALVGLLCFGVADGRRLATHIGFEMVASGKSGSVERGLGLLRALGDEKEMQRLCVRFGSQGMLYSSHVDTETARQIYYRVSGRFIAQNSPNDADFTWFSESDTASLVSTESSWPIVRGLRLKSSQLTAELDPQTPLAYLQWEMVFHNSERVQEEARAEIALPTGARVSRVTLWINGEPREAAFGGRSQVTTAYESVVVQRKDPLLVTTAGPNRVRMRAFPIPPQGEMRLLLGMTAPLDLVRSAEGRLDLPYFAERNFRLAEESRHHIRLINAGRAQRMYAPKGLANPFQMTDLELASFETFVAIHRDDTHSVFWRGEDPEAPELVARLISGKRPRPRHVVVVIDGSASVAAHRPELATSLNLLSRSWPELDLVFASDRVETRLGNEGDENTHDALDWLESRRFVGGQNNVPALQRGIELAAAQTGSAVLWLGGPQPIELTPTATQTAFLAAERPLPPIFVLPLAPGPQRLWDAFETVPLQFLPRYADLSEDILRFPGLDPGRPHFELRFSPPGGTLPPQSAPASDHLTRLWASSEVQRLLRQEDDLASQEALRLALQHQLVTPVSGAVVLETAEQYAANDLEPVDPATVPTIPEPEVWALLLVALASIAFIYRRRARYAGYQA